MKILLFGSTGMLGRYVLNILQQSYEVVCISRHQFDIEKDQWNRLTTILDYYSEPDDIIINCAGAIPQKENNSRSFIRINTLFPHKVNDYANHKECIFIHITTDCVFDGAKGNCIETDDHTEQNIYGTTKSLGEPEEACVIRTSIIGEESYSKKSLLEWVRGNQNCVINGYTNHYWNGVTCHTLAKIILEMIVSKSFWHGVRHVYSPNTVSKYELCKYINEIYELNIDIMPVTSTAKNMTISSIFTISTNANIADIYTQIKEQKSITEIYDHIV